LGAADDALQPHEKLNPKRAEMAYVCAQLAAAGGTRVEHRAGADRGHILIILQRKRGRLGAAAGLQGVRT
jgi:UDP-N-acetylglucosamine enolpyruvyl transferase